MAKIEKRIVKTSQGLKEYTYLGCPLTRNRSPWCFRLCIPDEEGRGDCGRVAPHGFKSRIQLGIEAYNRRQLEEHCARLERMYLSAPCNEPYEPGISIAEGVAEIIIPIRENLLDAAGSVHPSVCFRAMEDAARLAVSSTVQRVAMRTSSFNVQLARPVASGELIARARLMDVSDDDYRAEAVLISSEGEEIGRGSGSYLKSSTPLSPEIGYA